MAIDYDIALINAKRAMTKAVCQLGDKGVPDRLQNVAVAVDELNKAWDALTDCLVRQRDERDRVIRDLIDQLAEARCDR